MRHPLLFLLALVVASPAAAQHTELIGRAGVGLLRFGGQDAASVSGISYYEDYFGGGPGGRAYEPYGRKAGMGFAISGRVQRVGQRHGLLALDLGYDRLQSQVDVNQIQYSSSLFSSFIAHYNADGKAKLQSQRLTAFLGLGHRFRVGAAELDVLAGPEVAYVFNIRQRGSGTYNNGTAWTVREKSSSDDRVDAGLRADATFWYQKVGVTAGYSHGVVNYQGNLTGGSSNVYSRTWRFGMAYRLQ